jgi:hypothetical protein
MLTGWIELIKNRFWPQPHPSKLSEDEIISRLSEVWSQPYSRKNQRLAALLMDHDGVGPFAGNPAEDIFEQVVGFAMKVSLLIAGKPTTLQHSYASYMLYRICVAAGSVTEIYSRHEREPRTTLDHGSIAVICRTMIDASVMYWYLAEQVSEEEWAFRLLVLKVHDTASRVRLFKAVGPDEAINQRAILRSLKDDLAKNPLFIARNEEQQKALLSGQTIYVNGMRSLLPSMNIGKVHFDGLYNYLSAQVHLAPLSYFRSRQGHPDEIIFVRNFMQLSLYETSRVVVRVVLREVELSNLKNQIDPNQIAQMREFARPTMGLAH